MLRNAETETTEDHEMNYKLVYTPLTHKVRNKETIRQMHGTNTDRAGFEPRTLGRKANTITTEL